MKKLAVILAMMSSSAFAMISQETKEVAAKAGAIDVIEVTFDSGSSTLTDAQKNEIAKTVSQTKRKGALDRIEVLAWSDKEYPSPNQKHGQGDLDLATRRANEVKKYLNDSKTAPSVDTFNMAERPNKFEETLKLADAKVKDSMEAGGAAPTTPSQTGLFGQKGQASKALLMVFLK